MITQPWVDFDDVACHDDGLPTKDSQLLPGVHGDRVVPAKFGACSAGGMETG